MSNNTVDTSSQEVPQTERPLAPINVRAVLSALPSIALIWLTIWISFILVDWSLGGLMHLGTVGYAIIGCLLFVPAVWASYKIVILAIAAERELAAAGY